MLQGLLLPLGSTVFVVGALALASFLTIYWILRGAPPLQAAAVELDADAPSIGFREGLILKVTAGMVLIIVGACIAVSQGILWSAPVLAAGMGLVVWPNLRARQYRHASPIVRRTSELSRIFLDAALLAGILIVANVAAFRYGGQGIDLTRERTFSLSSLTSNQLASLNRPVTFHLVYGSGPRSARQLDRASQLLELYRAARPDLVKLDTLNPFTELARAEDLAKRAPDLGVTLVRGGGVLIEYGQGSDAQFVVVTGQEMFEPTSPTVSRQSSDRFESVFKGEDAITAALIRLREGRRSKVAFTTGHGEPPSSDLSPNSQGIGIWRARLTSIGCEVSDLNLIRDAIPGDLALLIIPGPRSPFKPEEIARLKAYADKSGPVLVLCDNTEPAGLDEFLRSFNLEIGRGLVIDPRLNFNRNVQLVFTLLRGGQGHPITDSLPSDRAVLLPNAAPIQILGQATPGGRPPAPPVNRNLVPDVILRSGPQSWAETDLKTPRPRLDQGVDQPGPVVVGVAVAERPAAASGAEAAAAPPVPRLVLFSSRSLGDNIVQGIEPTNLDLLMNAVSWLRGRPDVVGIAASTHVALTLTADPLLRNRLVLVPTVLAVLGTLAVGSIVYVARRE
jgi:hypothetical protein